MLDERWQMWERDNAEAKRLRRWSVGFMVAGAVLLLLGWSADGSESVLLLAGSAGLQLFGSVPCSVRAVRLTRPYVRRGAW